MLSDKMNYKGVHLPCIQKSEDAEIKAISYYSLRPGLIAPVYQTGLSPLPTLPSLKTRNHNSI